MAQAVLAGIYMSNQLDNIDGKTIFDLARRSADHNNLLGQCCLAECYASGIGVEQNLEEAVKWSNKAVDELERNTFLWLCI